MVHMHGPGVTYSVFTSTSPNFEAVGKHTICAAFRYRVVAGFPFKLPHFCCAGHGALPPMLQVFLKRKCGGSLLAAWRRHLDRHASMSVTWKYKGEGNCLRWEI